MRVVSATACPNTGPISVKSFQFVSEVNLFGAGETYTCVLDLQHLLAGQDSHGISRMGWFVIDDDLFEEHRCWLICRLHSVWIDDGDASLRRKPESTVACFDACGLVAAI